MKDYEFENGKYTIRNENGVLTFERYGHLNAAPSLEHSKLILAMLAAIDERDEKIEQLELRESKGREALNEAEELRSRTACERDEAEVMLRLTARERDEAWREIGSLRQILREAENKKLNEARNETESHDAVSHKSAATQAEALAQASNLSPEILEEASAKWAEIEANTWGGLILGVNHDEATHICLEEFGDRLAIPIEKVDFVRLGEIPTECWDFAAADQRYAHLSEEEVADARKLEFLWRKLTDLALSNETIPDADRLKEAMEGVEEYLDLYEMASDHGLAITASGLRNQAQKIPTLLEPILESGKLSPPDRRYLRDHMEAAAESLGHVTCFLRDTLLED